MKFKIKLNRLKSTKGTIVYGLEEPGEGDFITQLYIKRAALPKAKKDEDYPDAITVSVSVPESAKDE